MCVPKYIKIKMHRIATLQKQSTALSQEVDNWFITHGFNIEELRCGDGQSLEEPDYGNDATEGFCKRCRWWNLEKT